MDYYWVILYHLLHTVLHSDIAELTK